MIAVLLLIGVCIGIVNGGLDMKDKVIYEQPSGETVIVEYGQPPHMAGVGCISQPGEEVYTLTFMAADC